MGLKVFGSKYLRIEDVSSLLKISARAVGDMLRAGDIPARKIGGKWHVSQINLIKWLESPENQGNRKKKKKKRKKPPKGGPF